MIDFIQTVKTRNETLFYYGIVCLVFALFFLALTKITNTGLQCKCLVQAVQICLFYFFICMGYGLVLRLLTII